MLTMRFSVIRMTLYRQFSIRGERHSTENERSHFSDKMIGCSKMSKNHVIKVECSVFFWDKQPYKFIIANH